MSDTLKPPAPSKWAMEAAKEIEPGYSDEWLAASLDNPETKEHQFEYRLLNNNANINRRALTVIIARHHAAAQAETVALLEECASDFEVMATHLELRTPNAVMLIADIRKRAVTIRTHLAQLKEGAPWARN